LPWRLIGSALPTSWFIHLVVSWQPATTRLPRSIRLPQTFAPLQSLTLDHLAYNISNACERSPEVLRPFSVIHTAKATTPGFASPGSCCAFALTMCLDALLLRGTPWCLSTRLAPGVSPFSACLVRDRPCLSTRPSPLVFGSTRLLSSLIRKWETRPPALPYLGTDVASLQGLAPSDALEQRRWISPLATMPLALLGFFLTEAFSSRASDLVYLLVTSLNDRSHSGSLRSIYRLSLALASSSEDASARVRS